MIGGQGALVITALLPMHELAPCEDSNTTALAKKMLSECSKCRMQRLPLRGPFCAIQQFQEVHINVCLIRAVRLYTLGVRLSSFGAGDGLFGLCFISISGCGSPTGNRDTQKISKTWCM